MILKSSERANAKDLADHLTNLVDNEIVVVLGSRHLITDDDVHGALLDMEAIAAGNRCKNHMHHAMLNPDEPMTQEQWDRSWSAYEAEFGLEDQPFIEVEHLKNGRSHRHRVYHRLQMDGPAITFSNSYQRNEKIARILEHEFGHDMTVGRHNKAVIHQLRKEGLDPVADRMEQNKAHEVDRPVADKNHAEHQAEKRTGYPIEAAKHVIREAWDHSDSGASFRAALEAEGFVLALRDPPAKGNPTVFQAVDLGGNVHPLTRRLGEKAKIVRKRFVDLDLETVPHVDQAKEQQAALKQQQEQDLADLQRDQEAEKTRDPDPAPEIDAPSIEPPDTDPPAGQGADAGDGGDTPQLDSQPDPGSDSAGAGSDPDPRSQQADADDAAAREAEQARKKKQLAEERRRQLEAKKRKKEQKNRRKREAEKKRLAAEQQRQKDARQQQKEQDKRRQQDLLNRKRDEFRRKAAEKAKQLKEELKNPDSIPDGQPSLLDRMKQALIKSSVLATAVDWIKDRFKRNTPPEPPLDPPADPDQQGRDKDPQQEAQPPPKEDRPFDIIDLEDPDLEVKRPTRGIGRDKSLDPPDKGKDRGRDDDDWDL